QRTESYSFGRGRPLYGLGQWDALPARDLTAARAGPRRRAAEQRDEVAAPHSITSSARASSVGGISWLSILAVLRLITNSNLVGCSTGRSPGFAPFNILSTNVAALLNNAEMSTP